MFLISSTRSISICILEELGILFVRKCHSQLHTTFRRFSANVLVELKNAELCLEYAGMYLINSYLRHKESNVTVHGQ